MAQPNAPSILLSDQENELLFTLVGSRRQSKASAVVQMFHANVDSRENWTKFKTGVVCFVKDNPKKSYFIRLYDLTTKSMVYEQEIYNQFTYSKDRTFFHSYPGDKLMVGLNFASEDEAAKFNSAVNAKLQEREKKATIKRTKDDSSSSSSINSNSNSGHPMPISKAPVNTVDAGTDQINPFSGSSKKSKPRKPKGKLSKSDIGAPSDFRHLSHVGFDPSTGAFDSSNISPEWKQLLDHVGVTNEELKNKDTATFIYDFVEKHGGIEEANRQLLAASSLTPPPPPPSRKTNGGRDRELPAPPSSRNRGAPPPPPSNRAGPPPAGVPAPPPPPPPPPIGGPAVPPLPPMKSGGGGGPPPPPSRDKPSPNPPPVNDGRGNLLASIRKGKQLKKVTAEDSARGTSPPADSDDLDGMAGALSRALAQRNNVLQQSDSEEDEEWAAEEEEDEWSD